jgi:CRISPR-associated protein Cas5t
MKFLERAPMLRLEIYQESAHFRIPTIGIPYLSYPLPPPSTVYGFLRSITSYESINFENTKLSIQGIYRGISFEKEQLIIETKKEIKTNIIPVQKLHQCSWIIHIKSPFEKKIISALESSPKIFRLGRREDLIIDVNVEKVEEKEFDRIKCRYEKNMKIYKVWNRDSEAFGSLFRMALDTVINDKKEIIGYKSINLIYTRARRLAKDCRLFDGKYLIEWLE